MPNEHALRDMADNIQDGRIEWDAIAADGGVTIADVMVNGLLTAADEIESLRAELDSLRNFLGDMSIAMPVGRVIGLVESLRGEVERLKGLLSSIRALHDEYDGPHTYCRECGGLTPCDTMVVAKEMSDG